MNEWGKVRVSAGKLPMRQEKHDSRFLLHGDSNWIFIVEIPCLIVIAGRQSLSSSNIERQTVPDGYTFG